jgi:hypothetical protein
MGISDTHSRLPLFLAPEYRDGSSKQQRFAANAAWLDGGFCGLRRIIRRIKNRLV